MKKMAVHNGTFHADDVFAVALIRGLFGEIEVVRTRDERILATCDLVADVGGGPYDHHIVEKELREDGIPYSAFGLLWRDFGKDYIAKMCPELTEEEHEKIQKDFADGFITQIDAGDNGIDPNTYEIPVTTLSQVISSYIPLKKEGKTMDEGFFEAVDFAERFLAHRVLKKEEAQLHFNYVKEQMIAQEAKKNHLLVLEQSARWKEAVLTLDEEGAILFVVFEDTTGSWRLQTVPVEEGSFTSRCDLPKAWGGLRSEELVALTGVKGAIFCHPNLFICGNETKEGILQMAHLALQEALMHKDK